MHYTAMLLLLSFAGYSNVGILCDVYLRRCDLAHINCRRLLQCGVCSVVFMSWSRVVVGYSVDSSNSVFKCEFQQLTMSNEKRGSTV
jgi:hypothetical protein